MIFPSKLQQGDLVRIISPAGKVNPALVHAGAEIIRSWGLRVDIAPNALSEAGRFAADPEARRNDLVEALMDPDVKAVFCSRGGYGAVQLLRQLPVGLVRMRPKWLVGYSDVTLLHAFWNRESIISLHAPMCAHLAEFPANGATLALRNLLFGKRVAYEIPAHSFNRTGKVRGRLRGGNLAVMCGLRGTQFDFNYQDTILFIEDIAEQPYKIERMLFQLYLGGVFDVIAGLVVGQFTECPEDPGMTGSVYGIIRNFTDRFDFPVCFDFPVGHVEDNRPLPVGAMAELKVTPKGVTLEVLK